MAARRTAAPASYEFRTWAGAEREKREVELSYENALNSQPKKANEPVTVRQAIAMFTAKKAKRSKGTLAKYRQTLERLQVFCDREGRFPISEMTESDLQRFQSSWRFGSAITERNHQERLRAFFRYCCASNEIRLPYNPTAQLEHIDISDREPTPPFTEKEYKSILAAIPEAELTTKQQQRIRGMILVMRHAGLSIQDAAILEKSQIQRARVKGKECYRIMIRRSKTGTQVTISGSGFGATQGSGSVGAIQGSGNVWIGRTYASVLGWSDTQAIASVASSALTGIVNDVKSRPRALIRHGMRPVAVANLKCKLHCQLSDSGVYRCIADDPKLWRGKVRVGISKLRMVQCVEELGAKF